MKRTSFDEKCEDLFNNNIIKVKKLLLLTIWDIPGFLNLFFNTGRRNLTTQLLNNKIKLKNKKNSTYLYPLNVRSELAVKTLLDKLECTIASIGLIWSLSSNVDLSSEMYTSKPAVVYSRPENGVSNWTKPRKSFLDLISQDTFEYI